MGAGVHVRVHAQAHARGAAGGHGHRGQHVEFGLALDVEAQHAGFQRAVHVGAALAHAREHGLGRVTARGDDALQFPRRDDVEAAARLREGLQHRQRGVGLHGVAHQVRPAGQGTLVAGQGGCHRAPCVHVQGRAEALAELGQRAAVQHQVLPLAGQPGCAGQGRGHGGGSEGEREGDKRVRRAKAVRRKAK